MKKNILLSLTLLMLAAKSNCADDSREKVIERFTVPYSALDGGRTLINDKPFYWSQAYALHKTGCSENEMLNASILYDTQTIKNTLALNLTNREVPKIIREKAITVGVGEANHAVNCPGAGKDSQR